MLPEVSELYGQVPSLQPGVQRPWGVGAAAWRLRVLEGDCGGVGRQGKQWVK